MRRLVLSAVLLVGAPSGAAAQGVPPPTPVPPLSSPSPYPTALETPRPSAREPRVEAASAILADLDSGQVLWERNADEPRPIASVTKIMTALLVLEATGPGETVTASANAADQTGAELGLVPGEALPVRDLLMALLLQSANDAAVALAEHVGGSIEGFVDGMNRRAHRLGARDTVFASPNGLDDSGYSTARDLVTLTAEAYRDRTFTDVAATRFHRIPDPDGDPRRIQNRNALLWLYPGATGVKTGYTAAAGFCLVAAAERDGLRLVTVILGAPQAPWSDAAEILNHGFAAWERTVVDEATPLEPLEVDGRSVPIRAGASLSLVVRRDEEIEVVARPEPGLSLPIAVGEEVGRVDVIGDDGSFGEVPLVAAETVAAAAPPEEHADPWWERAWDAVVRFFGRAWRAVAG
jgi:D-alanyl-D-alanine carboxypeptidase (penicillin-binding protein 5/6)